ncbi:MAG: DUF2284 domain-containing protein [Rikenellaceae bacterium]
MYKIEEISATIGMTKYCEEYRNVEFFLGFCRQCNGFGKTWACPPFELTIDIDQYEYAHIFGTKIWVDSFKQSIKFSREQLHEEISSIIDPIRKRLDTKLIQLEENNKESRALFAGSCKGCPTGECTRPHNKPCAKPHLMRPSLEAMGFDVGKTTSQLLGIELMWCNDHLPPYFTLVYALFSNEPQINN